MKRSAEEIFVLIAKEEPNSFSAIVNANEPVDELDSKQMFYEFIDVFPDELPDGLPPQRDEDHRIKIVSLIRLSFLKII